MTTKRPNTLETVMLALELLRRIPRGRKVTATELQSQLKDAGFKRDLRSIQRLLEQLSARLEIERDDSSKPFGYRWKEQAKTLAVPNLTPQESLLLLLSQKHLRNLLPTRLVKSMAGFFEQAQRNLGPGSNAMLERQWPAKVRTVADTHNQPLLPPELRPGVFETVSEALYANHWLRLDYCNARGEQRDIEVMPLGMAQQGPRLYLVVRYKGHDNERTLALHRIVKAERAARFERPADFDLEKFDQDGRFGFGEGKCVRLSFKIKKDAGLHLLESPLSKDQRVKELDDAYEITATVVETTRLEWWLRGFGETVWDMRRQPCFAVDE